MIPVSDKVYLGTDPKIITVQYSDTWWQCAQTCAVMDSTEKSGMI